MKDEVFNILGACKCGHGANFIHEEMNNLVKSFLLSGTATTWEQVSRETTDLREMKVNPTNSSDIF